MKLLFDSCHIFAEDNWGSKVSFDWNIGAYCKLGIDWYKFKPVNGAKLKGSGGFSLVFYVVKWRISFTWVYDYKAYLARQNYRVGDRFKVKK